MIEPATGVEIYILEQTSEFDEPHPHHTSLYVRFGAISKCTSSSSFYCSHLLSLGIRQLFSRVDTSFIHHLSTLSQMVHHTVLQSIVL